MRAFLRKTLIAIALFAALATALDALIAWRSHGRQFERYADLNVINAGKPSPQVVVMGNSRARYHFDPRILEAALGERCYNLGMIGYPVMDQLGKLAYHLRHNTPPDLVIVNMDEASWLPLSRDTITQYEQFLDDIRDPVIFDLVRPKNGFKYTDLLPWSRFSGYPGYVWKIACGDTLLNAFNGFIADTTVMPPAALRKALLPYSHDTAAFDTYLDAIRAHRASHWPGVRIVYVESPYFQRGTNVVLPWLEGRLDTTYERALAIDLGWVGDTGLFMNRTHLNQFGAERYSRILSDSLGAHGY